MQFVKKLDKYQYKGNACYNLGGGIKVNEKKINEKKRLLEKNYETKKIDYYYKKIFQEYTEIERLLLISETSEKIRKMKVKERKRNRMFLSIVLIIVSLCIIVIVEVKSLLGFLEPLGGFLYILLMLLILGFLLFFNMHNSDKDTSENYPNDERIIISIELSENKIKSYRHKISKSNKKIEKQ